MKDLLYRLLCWLGITQRITAAGLVGNVRMESCLTAKHIRDGKVIGIRQVKNKCITTAYATFLALMHQTDATTIGDFKYHDSGIGTGNEDVGDVGLGTPWGGSRDVGTQVASTNTYTSVATTTYNATKAITEHGLFNASTGVTLMDRSKFAAINVVDTDKIEWTYVITFATGG